MAPGDDDLPQGGRGQSGRGQSGGGKTTPPSGAPRPTTRPPSVRPGTHRPSARAPDLLGSARRLSSLDFGLVSASRRIVEGALGLVLGDHFVAIVDGPQHPFADVLLDAAVSAGGTAELVDLDTFGPRPLRTVPAALNGALARAQTGVLLAALDDAEHSLTEAIELAVRTNHLRFGHLPGASRGGVVMAFAADPSRIVDVSRAVRLRLRPDSTLRLRSPAGSDLTIALAPERRWHERAGSLRGGRLEPLPLAQLVTNPLDVSGVFVANAGASPEFQSGGSLARNPVHFELEGGVVRAVRCRDSVQERRVEQALRREHLLDTVGLVALGTNVSLDGATGEWIFDQTLPGLHLIFGSTLPEHTGARTGSRHQLVATGTHADIDLDGAPLLRSGHFVSIA